MVVYFSLVFISFVWLAIIILFPVLFGYGFNDHFFVTLYYACFKPICHQLPERSYFINGYQLPVCVRCFGIYIGLLAGALIYPIFKKINSTNAPKYKYLYFILIPVIFDGLAQLLNIYSSPHYLRLITGIWASAGLVFWVLPLFNRIYNNMFAKKSLGRTY